MLSSFEFDGKEMVEGNDGDGNWIDGANVDDAGGSNCCNDGRIPIIPITRIRLWLAVQFSSFLKHDTY